jgi:hypothetical protein
MAVSITRDAGERVVNRMRGDLVELCFSAKIVRDNSLSALPKTVPMLLVCAKRSARRLVNSGLTAK